MRPVWHCTMKSEKSLFKKSKSNKQHAKFGILFLHQVVDQTLQSKIFESLLNNNLKTNILLSTLIKIIGYNHAIK